MASLTKAVEVVKGGKKAVTVAVTEARSLWDSRVKEPGARDSPESVRGIYSQHVLPSRVT